MIRIGSHLIVCETNIWDAFLVQTLMYAVFQLLQGYIQCHVILSCVRTVHSSIMISTNPYISTYISTAISKNLSSNDQITSQSISVFQVNDVPNFIRSWIKYIKNDVNAFLLNCFQVGLLFGWLFKLGVFKMTMKNLWPSDHLLHHNTVTDI